MTGRGLCPVYEPPPGFISERTGNSLQQLLGIVVILALMVMILLLSKLRKKKIQPFIDSFAEAYCKVTDHVLNGNNVIDRIKYDTEEGGYIRALPPEDQPESIRRIFEQGVDADDIEQIKTMFSMQHETQEYLTSFNLIGKRINLIMNRCYDLTNLCLSLIDDPSKIRVKKDIEELEFYFTKQKKIREEMLKEIVSPECFSKMKAY